METTTGEERKPRKRNLIFVAIFGLIFIVALIGSVAFLAINALNDGTDEDAQDSNNNQPSPGEAILIEQILNVGNIERNFNIFLPSNYFESTVDVPLIFVFHGLGGTPEIIQANYDLEETAERENFIAVFPAGIDQRWQVRSIINNDDLNFFVEMLSFMKSNFRVKQESIYSTGHSNGAFFSTILACTQEDIAAVAVVSGGFFGGVSDSCSPNRVVPYLQIHGTADEIVLLEGLNNPPLFVIDSVDTVLNFWALNNGLEISPNITPFAGNVELFSFPQEVCNI